MEKWLIAEPLLRRLVASLSPRNPGLVPRAVPVRFVKVNVTRIYKTASVFSCQWHSTNAIQCYTTDRGLKYNTTELKVRLKWPVNILSSDYADVQSKQPISFLIPYATPRQWMFLHQEHTFGKPNQQHNSQ